MTAVKQHQDTIKTITMSSLLSEGTWSISLGGSPYVDLIPEADQVDEEEVSCLCAGAEYKIIFEDEIHFEENNKISFYLYLRKSEYELVTKMCRSCVKWDGKSHLMGYVCIGHKTRVLITIKKKEKAL